MKTTDKGYYFYGKYYQAQVAIDENNQIWFIYKTPVSDAWIPAPSHPTKEEVNKWIQILQNTDSNLQKVFKLQKEMDKK